MNFNLGPTKQVQELIFSRKAQIINHHPLLFNQNVIPQTSLQKHLVMFLDSKLNTENPFFRKLIKTIGLLRKLKTPLPRAPLIIIYKSLIKPHLKNMETIQYNAALAITVAIRGSSREELYQELSLETLQQRLWYRKLCCFYKILKTQSPKYLYSIIPSHNLSCRTRQCNNIPAVNVQHDFFSFNNN